MKKGSLAVRMLVLLSLLALTAACGGGGGGAAGGGGGGGGTPPPVPLATGTFVKQFDPSASSSNYFPFSGGTGTAYDTKTQYLYTSNEIGGSGPITKIRLRSNGTSPAVTCPNMTLKMGHTTVSALTTTFANNVNTGKGAEQTVLTDTTVTIPAVVVGSWIEVALTTPFDYNGVDNLVVDFERSTRCTASVLTTTYSGTGRRAYSSAVDTIAGTAEYDATYALGVDNFQPWMQFVFSGGDNLVIAADRGGNNGNTFAPASQGRTQFLILASDIAGNGPVTGIQFAAYSALAAPMTATYKVTLSHVSQAITQIGSNTFATNVGTNATVVAQAVSVSLPIGTSEWWTPLTGSFNYDGTSNLLVDVEATAVTGGFTLAYQTIASNRIMASTDPVAATGFLWSRGIEPKLRFNGGTMDVMPAGATAGLDMPFAASANSTQYLYKASQLGTSGNITGLACRAYASAGALTGFNYTVKMGHLTSALTTTFANNLPAGVVTVFSGSMSTPAVLQGDWVNIPFSSSFSYNGVDDLVLEIRGTASSAGMLICRGNTAMGYNSRLWAGSDATATTGTLLTQLIHTKFTIQK